MRYLKLFLEILAIIFIFVLIKILFIPNPIDNSVMNSTIPSPVGSPQFLQSLSSIVNSKIESGQSVTILPTGQIFLKNLLSEIKDASSTIDFTTYPWSEGDMSTEVISSLTDAARRGVSVRILLDALGGHTLSNTDVASLQAAGARIERYHSFSILNPLQYDQRDHMRSIVIDGKVGFIGGMGIGDDWLGDGITSGWSDSMFEVNGSMAESLQSDFAVLWNTTTGEVLAGPSFYPSLASSTESSSTKNNFISIASIPSENFEPVHDIFLYTILNAQKNIYIISPFIIPDADIMTALENKARAEVKVTILSPGAMTNATLLRDAWRSDYGGLLSAGVKLYEYNPQMIHTKIMITDDTWSVIGSANMDSRSESLNTENLLGVNDPTLASQLETIFNQDASNSTEITQTEWNSKNFIVKLWYDSIKLFSKQL